MLVFNPGQCPRCDAANLLDKVGGYAVVSLRTSLRVGPDVELHGLVRDPFDKRFSTFGTLCAFGFGRGARPRPVGPARRRPGLPRILFGGAREAF